MPKTCVVNSETENFDVYIGRGSKWGNPYTHLPLAQTKAKYKVGSAREAVEAYRYWIKRQPILLLEVAALKGKRLDCPHKVKKICHGHVLVALAEAAA